MNLPSHIIELLKAVRERRATAGQLTELLDFLQREDAAGLIRDMADYYGHRWDLPASDGAYDHSYWEQVADGILETDRMDNAGDNRAESQPVLPSRKVLPFWRQRRWVAAAVVIFLLGTAIVSRKYTHQSAMPADVTTVLKEDRMPGRNGAILTLGNGHQILLDTTKDGALASQGGSRLVKQNGRLIYTASIPPGKDEGLSPADVESNWYNIITTPKGRQFQAVLPDGTQVWLNAASSIRYPAVFHGKERKVQISGEAYFEVAKDPSRPFHVQVNTMDVEVLGTDFNINSYADEPAVKTTLLRGSIGVSQKGNRILLIPGQQAISLGDQLASVNLADLEEVMAWKNGRFQFYETDIQTLLRQVARWYDLDVVYEGSPPADRFSGKIPRDVRISQVLAVLEKNQIHFRIEGRKLFVLN
jgi:ferric-dicitrate binding protein FerR (iron transport regulator)